MLALKSTSKYFQEHAWLVFAISGPLLAVAIVILVLIFYPSHSGLRPITLDERTIYVSTANTEESRDIGLGGRESMATDEGMLFVFDKDGNYPFWMKDMRFALDIIWLTRDGTILYIQPDVVPATYPQVFAPSHGMARYVLELNGGYTVEHKVKVGDKIQL